MSSEEPGVGDVGVPTCLYCHSQVDKLDPKSLPCGHIICRACSQGSTQIVVRIVSPHAESGTPSDQKHEAGVCVFCTAMVRTPSAGSAILLDILRCVSCGGVCHNACDGACGHSMCEACIAYVCRTTRVCPACHQPLELEEMVPARSLRRRVNDMVYMCKYGAYGCGESGKVEGLGLHELQCEYGERVCDGCGRCVRQREWHHHLAQCPAVKLECPHRCGALYTRSELEWHAAQCDFALAVCDLPACDYHTLRRDLARHQADVGLHLTQLSRFHHSQQQAQIQQIHASTQQAIIQQSHILSQQHQDTTQQLQAELREHHYTIRELKVQLEEQIRSQIVQRETIQKLQRQLQEQAVQVELIQVEQSQHNQQLHVKLQEQARMQLEQRETIQKLQAQLQEQARMQREQQENTQQQLERIQLELQERQQCQLQFQQQIQAIQGKQAELVRKTTRPEDIKQDVVFTVVRVLLERDLCENHFDSLESCTKRLFQIQQGQTLKELADLIESKLDIPISSQSYWLLSRHNSTLRLTSLVHGADFNLRFSSTSNPCFPYWKTNQLFFLRQNTERDFGDIWFPRLTANPPQAILILLKYLDKPSEIQRYIGSRLVLPSDRIDSLHPVVRHLAQLDNDASIYLDKPCKHVERQPANPTFQSKGFRHGDVLCFRKPYTSNDCKTQ